MNSKNVRLSAQSIPWLWLSTATLSLLLGIYSAFPSESTFRLRPFQTPSNEPDKKLSIDVWQAEQPYLIESVNAASITEKPSHDLNEIRFWCPRQSQQWCEITYSFPIEQPERVSLAAIRQKETLVFGFLDQSAVAEIWIRSEKQSTRWERLGRVDANGSKFPEWIDVSAWVQKGSPLQIRFRLYASRALYHPTPNDPIGFAGAQALRIERGQGNALELQLWYRP